MSPFISFLVILLSVSHLPVIPSAAPRRTLLQTDDTACPLNFTALRHMSLSRRPNLDTNTKCQYISQGLHLLLSDYLRRTNSFLPPPSTAVACWTTYQSLVNDFEPNFDVRRLCGFQTPWISLGCSNITTKSQFDAAVPQFTRDNVIAACNQSLLNNSPCASCTTALADIHLPGDSIGNVTDCTSYPFIYIAAFGNRFGPTDLGTAKCLFYLDFTASSSSNNKKKKRIILISVIVVCGVVLILGVVGFWLSRRNKARYLNNNSMKNAKNKSNQTTSRLDSISDSTTLIRFSFDEIKAATKNFSRLNIIGKGGYGNVYKGVLSDGSEVALKRFKNCSASGDASFAHEVEVIASVRHVNLVALRGYCTATTAMEGHQRIIVCDLMSNGSVHDHLFGVSDDNRLSWPIRQKIALGTAKGLAYLHYGAQPMIIHRDIKASNILLDERFEPKVADFGLARFTPEGVTHLSTRVAGTMGYVAPEYALYGQLTERSDVYSFGVVLLELLSGKKALIAVNDGNPTLLTDWAWSLVRKGRTLDVVEEGMTDLGPPEVVEKYVLVAVLCSHPQLYARPTMDQVVKMLDTEVAVPFIPERPISLIANMDDIERSVSSSGSGQLSTAAGYQTYTYEQDHPESHRNEDNDYDEKDGGR